MLGNGAEERNQVALQNQVSWATADDIKGKEEKCVCVNVCIVGQVELSGVCLINEGLEVFKCSYWACTIIFAFRPQ